ncbi:MAG: hypothetical protein E7444_04955 [Ruminococcaceae bacterium]|nr:hypothetical protein [Oscillospiraceae bacterium]
MDDKTPLTTEENAESRRSRPRRRKLQRKKRPYLPFLLVLAALSITAFIIPLRPNYSESEKRELATFPPLTLEALRSGQWMRDFENWFTDTFPAREDWVSLGARIDDLHGVSSVTVQGAPIVADEIPDLPAKTAAPVEELPAATPAPVPTPAPLPESEPLPTPPPDLDAGADVDWEKFSRFDAVALVGDAAYELYGFVEANAAAYGKLIEKAATLLEDRCRVFSLVAPNATGATLSAEDYNQLGCSSQQDGIAYTYSFMDKATGVDSYTALRRHNSEYIYFRTDHHWSALGAWYAYEQWALAAGFEPVSLSECTTYDMGDFLGSYSRNYQVKAMEQNPDRVHAYIPPGDLHMYLNGKDSGYEFPIITDASWYGIDSKYVAAFLYGDRYLTELVNNDIEDDSACLLIKDSYGNPFSLYLTQHYNRVIVIDCRFGFCLSQLVNAYGIDDVIFLNGLTLSQSNDVIGLYKRSIN